MGKVGNKENAGRTMSDEELSAKFKEVRKIWEKIKNDS
jgi:hypothetical protein